MGLGWVRRPGIVGYAKIPGRVEKITNSYMQPSTVLGMYYYLSLPGPLDYQQATMLSDGARRRRVKFPRLRGLRALVFIEILYYIAYNVTNFWFLSTLCI